MKYIIMADDWLAIPHDEVVAKQNNQISNYNYKQLRELSDSNFEASWDVNAKLLVAILFSRQSLL